MSWREELGSDNDLTRIWAIERAGREGGPELVDTLLDVALHDSAEVQTAGGVAEVWEVMGDAAARALRGILAGPGIDERIRAAAFDVDQDDTRVATLLRSLGEAYEPVRRELETSGEERLRLRALRTIRPFDRPPDLSVRFLADASPPVRLEALAGSARLPQADLERALRDPVADVRLAAAHKLKLVADSPAVVDAAQVESDPRVRDVLAQSLLRQEVTGRVREVLRDYLVNDGGAIDGRIAQRLQRAGDTGVTAVLAARFLVDIPEVQLLWLVQNDLLLEQVPELRALVAWLHRHAPVNYLRYVTGKALQAHPVLDAEPDLTGLARRFDVDSAALNPLLRLGPEALRVQAVALRLRETVPLAERFRPKEPASLYVPCPGCGDQVQVMGDVDWIYHDDDRVTESEDGYTGTLTGDCPACGSPARAEVRLSQTTLRFARTRELTWDAVS